MKPRFLTEAQLDREFGVRAKLESGGNYGCHCAVFDGDQDLTGLAFDDGWWRAFQALDSPGDIGTVLYNGNVRCKGASVSDRLMCLIVTGDLVVEGDLGIYETEVLVCGDAKLGRLRDHDGYLKVLGKLTVRDPSPA